MRSVPAPELALLLLCARMHIDEDRARRIASLINRGVDWNAVVMLARRHGLVPLLHRTLSTLNSHDVPSEILHRLRSLSETMRLHNMVLVSELLNAHRALSTAGITAVPYKGPALAELLYQDFALRQFSDIDLLVKPADAARARHVLLAQGYVPGRRISPHTEAAWVRLHCEFAFTSTRQVVVELNWRVAVWYWRFPEIPPSVWSRLGRLTLAGVDLPWFATEDLLLVLCLHGCKHKWSTLKWIVDVAELLHAYPDLDWRAMTDQARQTGAEHMLALGLFLAHQLLDARLPVEVMESIKQMPLIEKLAAEVCNDLCAADLLAAGTLEELPFLARMAERLDMKICCRALIPVYFVLHRILRPCVAALRRTVTGGASGET